MRAKTGRNVTRGVNVIEQVIVTPYGTFGTTWQRRLEAVSVYRATRSFTTHGRTVRPGDVFPIFHFRRHAAEFSARTTRPLYGGAYMGTWDRGGVPILGGGLTVEGLAWND